MSVRVPDERLDIIAKRLESHTYWPWPSAVDDIAALVSDLRDARLAIRTSESLLRDRAWDDHAENVCHVLMILLGLDDEPEEGLAMTICDAAQGDIEAAKELRDYLRWQLGVPFARHALRYRREARLLDERVCKTSPGARCERHHAGQPSQAGAVVSVRVPDERLDELAALVTDYPLWPCAQNLSALVADLRAARAENHRLRETVRQARVWVTDAIESTGDTDDDLLGAEDEPGAGFWVRLLCARDALAEVPRA